MSDSPSKWTDIARALSTEGQPTVRFPIHADQPTNPMDHRVSGSTLVAGLAEGALGRPLKGAERKLLNYAVQGTGALHLGQTDGVRTAVKGLHEIGTNQDTSDSQRRAAQHLANEFRTSFLGEPKVEYGPIAPEDPRTLGM